MPGTFSNDMTVVNAAELTTNYLVVGSLKTSMAANDDYKIEGTYGITFGVSSGTGTGTSSVLAATPSANLNLTGSGYHFFQWIKGFAWPSMAAHAAGGIGIAISSDATPTAIRCNLSATIAAGGSSYAVNDELTVSGGTQTQQAIFIVTAVSGGAVTAVTPKATQRGAYTVLPANPASTTTGGSGSGCTLTVTWIYSTTNTKEWWVGGADTVVTDGWVNYVMDIDGTPDLQATSPSMSSVDRMGPRVTAIAVSKIATHVIDVSRYGTGITINDGTSGSPVTFADILSYDNNNTRALGVIVSSNGIYFLGGKFYFGTTSQTAVTYFKDTGKTLVYQGFPVNVGFYEIKLAGVVSYTTTFQLGNYSGGVASGGCTFKGADRYSHYGGASTGLVPAVWKLTGDSSNTVCKLYGSTFTEMSSANLRSDSEVRFCTFQNFGTITPNGATLDSNTFLDLRTTSPISASYAVMVITATPIITNCTYINCATALKWEINANTNGKLDGSSFISGGTGHAIELGTNIPTDITINAVTFTGYGADETTDAAIYNNSGKSITINITGGGTSPTVRNGTGASTTVVAGAVTVTVTVKDIDGNNIQDARVLVTATSGGSMPYNVTVTISRSGSTATVSHTAHGMATNDKVQIKGANEIEYNGVYVITKINNDSYSYTVGGAPSTPATGTIKATYAALFGLTSASGVITMSRVFTSSQPITGKSRKSTGSSLYKTANIIGTISSSAGFDTTIQMIPDE